jgi:hypothetical protein
MAWAELLVVCCLVTQTTVVVDVVDAGFMKITWFPHPASPGNCLPFLAPTKYTCPY